MSRSTMRVACRSAAGIVLCLAASMAQGQPATSAPLPPDVQTVVDAARKACGPGSEERKGFITSRDVNGDGVADYILDYQDFTCAKQVTMWCGSGGCRLQVFASMPGGRFKEVINDTVNDFAFTTLHGRPAVRLGLHQIFCGPGNVEGCHKTFTWSGKAFKEAK